MEQPQIDCKGKKRFWNNNKNNKNDKKNDNKENQKNNKNHLKENNHLKEKRGYPRKKRYIMECLICKKITKEATEIPENKLRRKGGKKKRASHFCKALCLIWRRPTFPLGVAVSSARQGLTSLFEMVRGVHLLYNHQKYLKYLFNLHNITHIQEGNYSEVFGWLVLLGFDIAAFTPATYLSRRLQLPY